VGLGKGGRNAYGLLMRRLPDRASRDKQKPRALGLYGAASSVNKPPLRSNYPRAWQQKSFVGGREPGNIGHGVARVAAMAVVSEGTIQ
jgi:hypothetical protein